MSFEDFDKELQEAAEKHHPVYQEDAWSKMQRLLDTELPREEKKKRRWLLLPLFLLMGGSIWLFTVRPWNDKSANKEQPIAASVTKQTNRTDPQTHSSAPAKVSESNPADPSPSDLEKEKSPAGSSPGAVAPASQSTQVSEKEKTAVTSIASETLPDDAQMADNSALLLKKRKLKDALLFDTRKKERSPEQIKENFKREQKQRTTKPSFTSRHPVKEPLKIGNEVEEDKKSEAPLTDLPATEMAIAPADTESSSATTTASPVTASQNTPPVTGEKNTDEANPVPPPSPKKTKKKGDFMSRFVVSASGGLSRSAIRSSDPGKTRSVYGVGLGYALTKNLLLRTGLYAGDKIYPAAPGDYKPNQTYPVLPGYELQKIDAACHILEMPIAISWRVLGNKNNNWYVSGSVSSVWMKSEDYTYHYKTLYGYKSYAYQYKNENKHPFSLLGFGMAWERRLGKNISLLSEPYIRLPLGGIGHGNVRLKDAGILVSVNWRPFALRK